MAIGRRAVGILLLTGLHLGACEPARAEEARYETTSGSFQGEVLSVRWRESSRSAYSPELVVLLESTARDPVAVRVKAGRPLCNGEPSRFAPPAVLFLADLYPGLGPEASLQPGEWDALVFPLGLPLERERGDLECVHRFEFRAFSDGQRRDVLELVVPAPPPPPGKRD